MREMPGVHIDQNRCSHKSECAKAQALLKVLENNPYQNLPPYENLVGDLQGVLSRRINIQHRLVYEVFDVEKTVKVMRMWTHYE